MAADYKSEEVLSSILEVLKGIDKKLNQYEDRLRRLEDPKEDISGEKLSREDATDHTLNSDGAFPAADDINKIERKIPYSEWHTNHLIESLPSDTYTLWDTYRTNLDEFLDLRLTKVIEQRVKDCLILPDDDRMPLKFFKSSILKFNLAWGNTPKRTIYQTKRPFEKELDFLCNFDEELRKHRGNDFAVIDFDDQHTFRLYRVGERAKGPDLMVNADFTGVAPWSRIM